MGWMERLDSVGMDRRSWGGREREEGREAGRGNRVTRARILKRFLPSQQVFPKATYKVSLVSMTIIHVHGAEVLSNVYFRSIKKNSHLGKV